MLGPSNLANGMITTQGPEDEALYSGAEISFAITGGTGPYLGAKGEVRIKRLEGQDRQFTYTFFVRLQRENAGFLAIFEYF